MERAVTTRDHGGNLDAAIARFGGTISDWLDLSTGINPVPYPVPPIATDAWAALPRKTDQTRLITAAQRAYGTQVTPVPFAGAQGAIQILPFLIPTGAARVLTPTYNEHQAALEMAGWSVSTHESLRDLSGADLAVVVNPNNPDGRCHDPQSLTALAGKVGLLIVDESFADTQPESSLAPTLNDLPPNIIVLRSFGKFYGLAGLRLGFALARENLASQLAGMAGPWPVSGPAIGIASQALVDTTWQDKTRARLGDDAKRLDALARRAGWSLVGGTDLFRTYATPDATAAQNSLARAHVWSRIFPYSAHWLRLGMAPSDKWDQVARAFTGCMT